MLVQLLAVLRSQLELQAQNWELNTEESELVECVWSC